MSASSGSPASLQPLVSRAQADLDRFFDLTLDLLCVVGFDGRFRRVNPAWTHVLGWTGKELLERSLGDILHAEDREAMLAALARLARGEPVRGLENRYICKDGSVRWLSWQISVDFEAGTFFAIARDITQRLRADQERLVTIKLESTGLLANGIAHDFNNLLTGLLLNLEMVRLVGPVGERQARHLAKAQEAVRAAQELTRQLVIFAQGGGAARRVVDPAPLLRQAFELALGGSAVRGECDIEPGLLPVEVDEAQLAQVVRNLALNAREATPAGGLVRLRAGNLTLNSIGPAGEAPGDYLCFSVSDTGPGVPPELLGKVFDPYFSTKERGTQRGMGLGLTICHAVLQRHGGYIAMDSAPGRGATVRCLVPAALGRPAAVTGAAVKASASAATRRVLVMDDEPWLRDVIGQALGRVGYAVELASDGAEAIRRFREARERGQSFGVVLLDLTVRGGMGGREVIGVLRGIDPGLRAVLMTGYNHEETLREHTRHGFQAALSKPFSIENLQRVIGELCEKDADDADTSSRDQAGGI